MDPDTALTEALAALVDQDRDTAIERLLDLTEWLQKDGALPVVIKYTDSAFFVRKPENQNHD